MLAPAALSPKARALPGIKTAELDHTVLGTIINAKAQMLEHFEPAPMPEGAGGKKRSLKEALTGTGRHFILECKRASPSLGDINLGLDFKAVVEVYNQYASAISVLTESTYFKGSYEYLREVKAQTHLPVILKDFVVDEREVLNAKAIGADALLLMTSVLTEEKFIELYKLAYSLGLEVLCEVSTEEEARFAKAQGIEIVGINNRNLKTLQIDLNTAKRLSAFFTDAKDTVLVSESGVKSHQDIVGLKPLNNFLIGSAICGSRGELQLAVKSLLFGMNKICGLTTVEAVKAAAEHRAALCGLIFAPKSPRCVSLDKARELMAADSGQVLAFTGVFVNADLNEVINTAKTLNLPFVQLHGSESADYIKALQQALPETRIIKAIAVSDESSLEALEQYQGLAVTFLFDSKNPGSGKVFDHELLAGIDKKNALLSGGLGLENIEKAAALGFLGLDLNSKLESAPGVKDPNLVAQALDTITAF